MQPPKRQELTFTREEFYEKVWSSPATMVAKEVGLSDVTIAKVCKAFDIPKPYVGYWAKQRHGKNPKRTPLPKNEDPHIQSLTFYIYPDGETTANEPEPEYDDDIQQMLDKARNLEPVKVTTSLREPHPLVALTRDRIRTDRPTFSDYWHSMRHHRGPTLAVHVSKDTATRALCIMDALIKRVEQIGGQVEVNEEKWTSTTVVCFSGEQASLLRLREKYNQVSISPEDRGRYLGYHARLEPSGLLILDQGPETDILLRDTPKRRRIEDGLNDLIIGFVKQAGVKRICRRSAEETGKRREEEKRIRRLQEEELRRRREELAKRKEEEQARVDELVEHSFAWQESRVIREYLAALCEVLLDRDGAIAVDGEAAQYLRWAHQQADRRDPLRPSSPSVLDESI